MCVFLLERKEKRRKKENEKEMKNLRFLYLGRVGAGHVVSSPGFHPAIRVSVRINYLLLVLFPDFYILLIYELLRI